SGLLAAATGHRWGTRPDHDACHLVHRHAPPPAPAALSPEVTRVNTSHTALVTGASGYVGGLLVPRLLEAGYAVRVLTRAGHLDAPWVDRVDVVRGNADDEEDLRGALRGVDAAYYRIHSMDGGGSFAERDRWMSE